MSSKLSFWEAISSCFCYVFHLFYFCRQREGEEQKQRKKRRTVVHQWRAAPFNHRPPPPATVFPLPLPLLLRLLHSPPLFTLHVNSGEQLTISLRRFHRQPLLFFFPFPFSFIFCILHLFCKWTMESSSPPAFAVSTASHSSSPSSSAFFTVHVACE